VPDWLPNSKGELNMLDQSDVIEDESPIERTPEEAHYQGLFDAFVATLADLGTDKIPKREVSALKQKLAVQYYELTENEIYKNRRRSIHYAFEAVIDAWGISRTPSLSREEQKAAIDKYETDYLHETETNLILAQNALRMPRLTKRRRKLLEDDLTFYSSELVCHERYFKGLARRRYCTKLIDEHKIDRIGPPKYHYA
jgi:hypothetical protein